MLPRFGCSFTWIHGQPKKAPGKVSLNTLTHVAILVDKYELHEGTEFAIVPWVNKVKKKDMTGYEGCLDEVLQFLCITWVFRYHEMFTEMTYLAMLYSDGNLAAAGSDELPVPANVLSQCSLTLCS